LLGFNGIVLLEWCVTIGTPVAAVASRPARKASYSLRPPFAYDAVSSTLTPTICSGYLRMASTAGATLIWLTCASVAGNHVPCQLNETMDVTPTKNQGAKLYDGTVHRCRRTHTLHPFQRGRAYRC